MPGAATGLGGLVSYGIDQMEQARGGASYIDRVLRWANPGELPVQPDEVPVGYQIENCKDVGPENPGIISLARRRGDRVSYAPAFAADPGG